MEGVGRGKGVVVVIVVVVVVMAEEVMVVGGLVVVMVVVMVIVVLVVVGVGEVRGGGGNNYLRATVVEAPRGAAEPLQAPRIRRRRFRSLQRVKTDAPQRMMQPQITAPTNQTNGR